MSIRIGIGFGIFPFRLPSPGDPGEAGVVLLAHVSNDRAEAEAVTCPVAPFSAQCNKGQRWKLGS